MGLPGGGGRQGAGGRASQPPFPPPADRPAGRSRAAATLQERPLPFGRMAPLGRGGGLLEVFKLGCYLAIPIGMTAVFTFNPDNLDAIIKSRSYVVYPPEGPRPPSNEELWKQMKEGKR